MASSDAISVPRKNTAYRLTFFMFDADGDPVTGAAALDSEVSKDGAAFADCTNEATEIGNGAYYIDLTSTEMNADTVAYVCKTSTTGAKQVCVVMYPDELGDIRVNAGQVNGTTPESAATIAQNVHQFKDSGTAQAGAAGTITLRAGASASNNFYNGAYIRITGGTGVGQGRWITGYVGATKVATVDSNWVTNPDNTSTYEIL